MSNNNYGNSNNGSGNNDYWISKSFIKSIRSLFNKVGSFAFGFVFAVSLLAGVVYAWNAVWHGTDWIQPGAVIDSQKVAENFEWLNRKINTIEDQVNIINSSIQNAGQIVAGCYPFPRNYSYRVIFDYYCWGGARTSYFEGDPIPPSDYYGGIRQYNIICPNGTQRIVTGTSMYCRTYTWDGGDGGSYGAGSGGGSYTSCIPYYSVVCQKLQ